MTMFHLCIKTASQGKKLLFQLWCGSLEKVGINRDCYGVYLNPDLRQKWFCFTETVKRTTRQSHSNRHLNRIQEPLLSFFWGTGGQNESEGRFWGDSKLSDSCSFQFQTGSSECPTEHNFLLSIFLGHNSYVNWGLRWDTYVTRKDKRLTAIMPLLLHHINKNNLCCFFLLFFFF